MSKINASITAVGGYVPDYVLTNKELESMVDTNDEWITSRTGIKERRILKGENIGVSFMAIEAARDLIKKTNLNPLEIEAVVVCTISPDMLVAATACKVATEIGATNAYGFDLVAACSGFLYGLSVASGMIESGRHKKVLLIGADKMSSIVDYKDRATCIIFGDGAGAVLLEANTEGLGVQNEYLRSDGIGQELLKIEAGGSAMPASETTVREGKHYLKQEGRQVFKHATTNMSNACMEVMKSNDLSSDDIDWLIAHQANERIISYTAEKAGLNKDKVLMNISKYGNTTNATIPLLFWDYESKFKKGDNMIITAFGGGFTWGAMYMKWAY